MGLSDCADGTTELGRRVAAIAPTVVLLRRETSLFEQRVQLVNHTTRLRLWQPRHRQVSLSQEQEEVFFGVNAQRVHRPARVDAAEREVEQGRRALAAAGLRGFKRLDGIAQFSIEERVPPAGPKTLIHLASAVTLRRLMPDFRALSVLCGAMGFTGLYPFVHTDALTSIFEASPFPGASGYPEDAATGIAAALFGALSFSGLRCLDKRR